MSEDDTVHSEDCSRDPYVNAATGESLRTLIAEYAEQADEIAESVIVQAIHWHQWQAGYAEFTRTFPVIVRLGAYPVAYDDFAFDRDVHPWLLTSVGSGGYWNYDTTPNPRHVTIDPAKRDWTWAQYSYLLGFKRVSDATLFKLTYCTVK